MKKVLVCLFLIACVVIPVVVAMPQIEEDVGVAGCNHKFVQAPLQGSPLKGRDFSLLSWNVFKEQKNNWKKDFAQLSAGVDILALQEAPVTSGRNSILDRFDYSYSQTQGFRRGATSYGVVIGVRDGLIGQQATQSCGLRAVEPFIRIPKTAILTRVETSQGELMVVNIHSINFSFGVEAYSKQLTELLQLLEQYEYPIIVAGDFNTWSAKRQAIVDEFAFQLKLQPVQYSQDNRSMVFSHALDHVFVRGLQNVKTTVHEVSSSDHSPIRVDFSL